MKIIYGINNIKRLKLPVVAMGVFDGVHRGHRKILKAAVAKARDISGTSVVLTFWPHPQKEASLYSLEHRLRLIAELEVDCCLVINFSRHFSRMTAVDFVKGVLVDKIRPAYVYVGKNFRFGKNTQGNFALLKKLGRAWGFKAKSFEIIRLNGQPVSSTLIRGLIKGGSLSRAQRLLDRPVSILGTVIRGTAVGRILGFPTANIDPHHEIIPGAGIYAVRVIFAGRKFKGACYVGSRPTVNIPANRSGKKVQVEVHIFNFNQNIYGEYLEIQFVRRIRPDKKFPSLILLARQIQKDIAAARKILTQPS